MILGIKVKVKKPFLHDKGLKGVSNLGQICGGGEIGSFYECSLLLASNACNFLKTTPVRTFHAPIFGAKSKV